MNRVLATLLSVAVLIIALSVGYYFVIFLPEQARHEAQIVQDKSDAAAAQQAQETARAQVNEKYFEDCMTTAHDVFVNEGQARCLEAGYTQQQIDDLKCKLAQAVLDSMIKKQSDAQALCGKLYK